MEEKKAPNPNKGNDHKKHPRHRHRHHKSGNPNKDNPPKDEKVVVEDSSVETEKGVAAPTPLPASPPPPKKSYDKPPKHREKGGSEKHEAKPPPPPTNKATKIAAAMEFETNADYHLSVADFGGEESQTVVATDTIDDENDHNSDTPIDVGDLPRIGITIGDINGVGIEVILKTFADLRVCGFCVPILYGSSRAVSYHRKVLQREDVGYNIIPNPDRAKPKVLNILNCWNEEVSIQLGQATSEAGFYAFRALETATADLEDGKIDALVTAPVNKHLVNSEEVPFKGHTEYLTEKFEAQESLMFLVSGTLKVGLVTNHLAVKDVAKHITEHNIMQKLQIMDNSLRQDFGIVRPKIAVLALNPHAGDSGLIGTEEQNIIIPTLEKAQNKHHLLVFGPFSADGFFGSQLYKQFDAVLAMYHDQGLIPFKSLSFGHGVNFTAGLPIVRTSPDHGTAFDIAGKNVANEESFRQAIYLALDVMKNRENFEEMTSKPLRKRSSYIKGLANAEDEAVVDEE